MDDAFGLILMLLGVASGLLIGWDLWGNKPATPATPANSEAPSEQKTGSENDTPT